MMTSSKQNVNDATGGIGTIEVNQSSLPLMLANRLIRGRSSTYLDGDDNDDDDNDNTDAIRACIAVAGGGSYATSAIVSVPGASSVLLESIVVYDRTSFAEYVSRNTNCDEAGGGGGGDGAGRKRWLVEMEDHVARWRGAKRITTTTTIPHPMMYDVDTSFATSVEEEKEDEEAEKKTDGGYNMTIVHERNPPLPLGDVKHHKNFDPFRFCSIEAAMLLSQSALRRSLDLSPSLTDRCLRCAGVGCTSSLVAGPGEGRRGRRSRAYVACSTITDGTWVWELELDCGTNDGGETHGQGGLRRSRLEEEMVVSNVVLLAMVRCRELRQLRGTSMDGRIEDIGGLLGRVLDREGDVVTERRMCPPGFGSASFADVDDDDIDPRRAGVKMVVSAGKSVAWGASRIINGLANIVAILPITTAGRAVRMEALLSDCNIPLPCDVLIVPGSFNPPHAGHVGLASAAVSALRRLRQRERNERCSNHGTSSSSILRSMWDSAEGCIDGQYDPVVLFEMSVTNADKPPLEPIEVERRVDLFASLSLSSPDMPKDWAVILTNAPLFSQKTGIFDDLIVSDNDSPGGVGSSSQSGNENLTKGERRRKLSFVLGTDTLVRILNPKYYGNSQEMISALVRMKERGVHFIVGGRLEQGTKNSFIFVNGEEEVMSLPPEVQDMFTLLTEDEFRLDISSTELRKKIVGT